MERQQILPDNNLITTDQTIDGNTVEMRDWWAKVQESQSDGSHTVTTDPAVQPITVPFFPDLTGIWAIEERAGRFMYIMLNEYVGSGHNLSVMYPDKAMNYRSSDRYGKPPVEKFVTWYEGNVACVNVNGTLMRDEPPSSMFGESGITYRQLTDVLTELSVTDAAQKIVLKISSFGGNTLGAFPCADSIATVNKTKPITAYVDDNCASAAYLLASQCEEIIAAEGSVIGSIGTVTVLVDDSKRTEALGIRRVVVASSKIKGQGLDGKVTEDFKDNMQDKIDQTQEFFESRVKQGRGMTDKEVEAISTGDIYFPEDALKLKLIDSISNFHDLYDISTESDKPTSNRRPNKTAGGTDDMSDQDMAMKDQTIAELQAKVDIYEDKEKEKRIVDAAAEVVTAQMKSPESVTVTPDTIEAVVEKETKIVIEEEGSAEENVRFAKIETELQEEREKRIAMEAQMAENSKVEAQKEKAFRLKLVDNWAEKMLVDRRILPKDVQQVKMLVGTLIDSKDHMELECALTDGTTDKLEGQHYQIAMQVLESAFASPMQFSERVNSTTLNTEQRANIESDWLSKRMSIDGVNMDHEQALGEETEASQMGAELARDVGVEALLSKPGAVLP